MCMNDSFQVYMKFSTISFNTKFVSGKWYILLTSMETSKVILCVKFPVSIMIRSATVTWNRKLVEFLGIDFATFISPFPFTAKISETNKNNLCTKHVLWWTQSIWMDICLWKMSLTKLILHSKCRYLDVLIAYEYRQG